MALRPPFIFVALAGVTICAAACGDQEGEPASSPTPSATVSEQAPTATLTAPSPSSVWFVPDFLDGLEVVPLTVTDPIELPQDVALIIETGCWQCGSPPTGLMRVYRDALGNVHTDHLITAESFSLPYGEFGGFAVEEDGSHILAALCIRGLCQVGDGPTSDAQTAIHRSTDGGVTWRQEAVVDLDLFAFGFTGSGEVLMMTYDRAPIGSRQLRFLNYPSNSPVARPAPQAYKPLLADGQIFWRADDGSLYEEAGRGILQPQAADQFRSVYSLAGSAETGWLVSVDTGCCEGNAHRYFLLPFDETGTPGAGGFGVEESSGVYEGPRAMRGGARASSDKVLYGNIEILSPVPRPDGGFGPMNAPAVIDLESRKVMPIVHPFAEFRMGDRFKVVAVQQGPFARVVNTEGTCLNIRAEPGAGAALDCAAEGVLLRDLGQSADIAGVGWLRVATPAGVEGWASTQYLER